MRGGGAGPGGPGGAATGAPGARGGGITLDFKRQATAKKRLKIDWTFPVYKSVVSSAPKSTGGTVAAVIETALPREEAFQWVAGDDRRPLLVLRECNRCKGTDDALLGRRLDNEKTLLLTQWFHCIKLPTTILDKNHPFRALFDQDHPPHFFLAKPDGTGVVAMSGEQSQAELWASMVQLLKEYYHEDPDQAVKDWFKLLTKFDHLDLMEQTLTERFDAELEKNGPRSTKLPEMKADLDKVRKDREKAMEQEKAIRDLSLKPVVKEASGAK